MGTEFLKLMISKELTMQSNTQMLKVERKQKMRFFLNFWILLNFIIQSETLQEEMER